MADAKPKPPASPLPDKPIGNMAAKLRRMAEHLSPATPDSHVLFGVAGIPFTVGDLRALLSEGK